MRHRLRGVLLVVGVFVVCALAAPTAALAAIVTWDGGAGTNSWHDAANWSSNTLPAAGDDVVLPTLASSYTVVHSTGTTSVAKVDVWSGATLRVTGGTLVLSGAGRRGRPSPARSSSPVAPSAAPATCRSTRSSAGLPERCRAPARRPWRLPRAPSSSRRHRSRGSARARSAASSRTRGRSTTRTAADDHEHRAARQLPDGRGARFRRHPLHLQRLPLRRDRQQWHYHQGHRQRHRLDRGRRARA